MNTLERAAKAATFKSFANCYLREIDAGSLLRLSSELNETQYIEWSLDGFQATVRVELIYSSLCGAQSFGDITWRQTGLVQEAQRQWKSLDPILATHLLLCEAYSRRGLDSSGAKQIELLSAILDSCQNMVRFSHATNTKPSLPCCFIEAEQSLVFGHWQHPTPKSQTGYSHKAQEVYAPEFHNAFQLDYFAAQRSIVDEDTSVDLPAGELILDACDVDFELGDDECLLPLHPLQSAVLTEQPDIQSLIAAGALRYLGRGGRFFQATSSMRTLYSEDSDWMLKFSLPIRLTNSVRLNLREELEAGVAMSRLLRQGKILDDCGALKIIDDPAFLTLKLAGKRESGFEVIIRRNPFKRGQEQRVVQVAALTADPLPGMTSQLNIEVTTIALNENTDVSNVAERWFAAYLVSAFSPLVRLYDRYGIAYEAHQQNCLIDLSQGYPCSAYLRDNQGYYLSERYADILKGAASTSIGSLYYNEDVIRARLSYYLVINQVFSVIGRLGRDQLCEEQTLLQHFHTVLQELESELTAAGRDFVTHLLYSPVLTSKLNLTTRLMSVDELESRESIPFYHDVPNPLYDVTLGMGLIPRSAHAAAS